MKNKERFFLFTLFLISLSFLPIKKAVAVPIWKIDAGVALVHLDVLESGYTVQKLDIPTFSLDGSVVGDSGLYLKSSLLRGKKGKADFILASASYGRCIPLTSRVILNSMLGFSYTELCTELTLDLGDSGKMRFQEKFRGYSPFLGVEAIVKILPNFRICASGTYSWSRSKAKIKEFLTSKGGPKGTSLALLLEYDINSCLSVNLGGQYSESLSKTKSGLRGRGVKTGFAFWF